MRPAELTEHDDGRIREHVGLEPLALLRARPERVPELPRAVRGALDLRHDPVLGEHEHGLARRVLGHAPVAPVQDRHLRALGRAVQPRRAVRAVRVRGCSVFGALVLGRRLVLAPRGVEVLGERT